MPLSDQTRIAREQATPRIVELWRALTALNSVVSFMNTGAHPDDEISAMLAALRFRDGIDISFRGDKVDEHYGPGAAELRKALIEDMEPASDFMAGPIAYDD